MRRKTRPLTAGERIALDEIIDQCRAEMDVIVRELSHDATRLANAAYRRSKDAIAALGIIPTLAGYRSTRDVF